MKPTTKKTSLLSVCDVTERTKQLCSKKEKKGGRQTRLKTNGRRKRERKPEAIVALKKSTTFFLFIYLFIYVE